MSAATKDSSPAKVQVDRTLTEQANTKRAMALAITSKGFAIGDGTNVREYSPLDHTNSWLINYGKYMTILRDQSAASKAKAESGIPLMRLLRRKADVLAELSYRDEESFRDWSMVVYGEKHLEEMTKLAEELSSSHGINIKIKAKPELVKENFFHEPSCD